MSTPLIPVAEPDLSELEERYVTEAVRSGWVSSIGAFLERFEKDFAKFCETEHCVALSNGTVAIHLALVSRGIGPGDEVIVPDLTFAATAAAVVHAGATPVLVDVDPKTWTIDPALLERAISAKTRAIIPVHLYGHPADMDAIRAVIAAREIFILEDAAEAHGARFLGKRVGSLGDAASFSFYGNKLLTTGEGGCIVTNDARFAARVRFLKDHAMSADRRYLHPEVGYNYRMTNLQAALGCAQLERFAEILERHGRVLEWYREELAGSEVTLNPHSPKTDPVCWLVTAVLPGQWSVERQKKLMTRLRSQDGIDSRPFFVPMHEMPPYENCTFIRGIESHSSDLSVRGICLPSSSRMTREQVKRVSQSLISAL